MQGFVDLGIGCLELSRNVIEANGIVDTIHTSLQGFVSPRRV